MLSMKSASPYDTIAAVATPPGEGGIGIVRLSGDRAVPIVRSLFDPRGRGEALDSSFRMTLGVIRNNGRVVDEVLVSVMRAPHTYTREDVVEINCHGGPVAVNEVLSLVLEQGARAAEPGEFTRRAFINGRIDLAQAEAVLDIVHAKTGRALDAAVRQLGGGLSDQIRGAAAQLKQLLVHLEASIDFAEEEDVSALSVSGLRVRIRGIAGQIEKLASSYINGRILREGVLTVIAGRPNVGKSSLLNALLRYERAIVTEIPGTTRDVIEEQVSIQGIPYLFADTAGITETKDIIEKEGVKRSRSYLERSDLVILVLDGSCPLDSRDFDIAAAAARAEHVVVVNKCDLPRRIKLDELKRVDGLSQDTVMLSARTGRGMAELEKRLTTAVTRGNAGGDHSVLVTNARHHAALKRAAAELGRALETLARQENRQDTLTEPELISFDVRSALDALGEITGSVRSEEILEDIFQRFCIGK